MIVTYRDVKCKPVPAARNAPPVRIERDPAGNTHSTRPPDGSGTAPPGSARRAATPDAG